MFMKSSVIALALATSGAVAHFTLDYPTSRGFDEDLEPQFCGGFNTPTSPRIPFPLSGGPIQFDSHHTLATVGLLVSLSTNPTTFANFTQQANGTAIPFVEPYFQVASGENCFNTDFAKLGLGLGNGSLVTIQMQFNGGDGNLFQCADLILLTDFTAPTNVTCSSDASTRANATVTSTPAIGTKTASVTGSSTSGSASAAAQTSAKSGAERKMVAMGAGLVGVVGAAVMML